MTRKDYVLLAAALNKSQYRGPVQGMGDVWVVEQWYRDVAAIADALAADNPRFDRQRFTEACEK